VRRLPHPDLRRLAHLTPRAYDYWPNGWCLRCHAPDPAQQVAGIGQPARDHVFVARQSDPGPTWSDGVDCAACHVRDGVILTAGAPSDLARSQHPMAQDPDLGTERLCARCHSFPFQNHTPAWPFSMSQSPSQDTIAEWSTSAAAARGDTCQTCHLDGHRFPGAHDHDLVRDALSVQVAWLDATTLLATVTARDAPHRIPTGDPFRTMDLQVCADRACRTVLARQSLRRTFDRTDTTWVLRDDTTVPPSTDGAPTSRQVRLDVAGRPRAWRLWYRYGDQRFEADLPPSEVGFEVARGTLPEAPR
jgi:hypothetical protein